MNLWRGKGEPYAPRGPKPILVEIQRLRPETPNARHVCTHILHRGAGETTCVRTRVQWLFANPNYYYFIFLIPFDLVI